MSAEPGNSIRRHVVFVCTGNTCRSPLAEGAFRKHLPDPWKEQILVSSAGVSAFPGSPVSHRSVEVAAARGIDLSGGKARALRGELLEANLFLVMEESHRRALIARHPEIADRTFLLTEFLPPEHPLHARGIPDPFGGTREQYEETYRRIEEAIVAGWSAIEARLSEAGSLPE